MQPHDPQSRFTSTPVHHAGTPAASPPLTWPRRLPGTRTFRASLRHRGALPPRRRPVAASLVTGREFSRFEAAAGLRNVRGHQASTQTGAVPNAGGDHETDRRPRCEAVPLRGALCLAAARIRRLDSPSGGGCDQQGRPPARPRWLYQRMAQEFGDHPEEARDRMRWARQLLGQLFAPSPVAPGMPGSRMTAASW